MKQKPAFFINVITPPGTFDVNMSPDKREIALTNEQAILDTLKETVDRIYAPSRNTFVQSQPKDLSQSLLSYRSIERGNVNSQTSDSTTDENSDELEIISQRSQATTQADSTSQSSRYRAASQNASSLSAPHNRTNIFPNSQRVTRHNEDEDSSDEAEFDEEDERRRITKIRASELEACGMEIQSQQDNMFPPSQERGEVSTSQRKGNGEVEHSLEKAETRTYSSGFSVDLTQRSEKHSSDVIIVSPSSDSDDDDIGDDELDGAMNTHAEQEESIENYKSLRRTDLSDAKNISRGSLDGEPPSENVPMAAHEESKKRKAIFEVDDSTEEESNQIKMSQSVWDFDMASIKRACKKRRLSSNYIANSDRGLQIPNAATNVRACIDGSDALATEVTSREGEEGVRVLNKEVRKAYAHMWCSMCRSA
jgi:DNA mismatch repair ATPase MutL